ncbi:MAG: NTP transferase domain-containing protein [Deltaproteobacteria bacterium]|jgi:bifunctional UDP-N-acetylglucosamine pyrophosphorylase/glucosamine-1-phosphate N-acetyltransferase|nr:NTP transferase domain-containing protein [Deltaproteobacteria bacterium]
MAKQNNQSKKGVPAAPAVVVLAAGKGTRMNSDIPKVLRPVMGRPIITHVLNAARYLAPGRLVVVTGYGADEVEAEIAPFGPFCVRQAVAGGTGHAVQTAMAGLEGFEGQVIILPGDVPLISPQTLLDFHDAHLALGTPLSVLTVRVDDPASYGRVVRDKKGLMERIVETRDATDEELLIDEINSSVYAVDCEILRENIFNIKPNNDQKEYYLTDIVAEVRAKGLPVAAIEGPDPLEVQGINDCRELAMAQTILRRRINDSWLLAGVAMEDPATTYVEASVRLSRDVVLGPGVVLAGNTKVGQGVTIGPYCCLRNVEIEPYLLLVSHISLSDVRLTSDGQAIPLGEGQGDDAVPAAIPKKAPKKKAKAAAKPADKAEAKPAGKPEAKPAAKPAAKGKGKAAD